MPAIGQGAVGVECRADDQEINDYLKVLHDEPTTIRITAERAMNERLKGGCQVPIAGFAEIQGEQLFMRGLVGSPDGTLLYRAERTGSFDQAEAMGIDIADDLLAQGADKILKDLYQ